jgi:hypothetical protein
LFVVCFIFVVFSFIRFLAVNLTSFFCRNAMIVEALAAAKAESTRLSNELQLHSDTNASLNSVSDRLNSQLKQTQQELADTIRQLVAT